MTTEERDRDFHTLITCDGAGKEAKTDALRRLLEAAREDQRREDREERAENCGLR